MTALWFWEHERRVSLNAFDAARVATECLIEFGDTR